VGVRKTYKRGRENLNHLRIVLGGEPSLAVQQEVRKARTTRQSLAEKTRVTKRGFTNRGEQKVITK